MLRRAFHFDGRFDFDYRPEKYWPELPTEETVVAKVKGTVRRNVARQLLKEADETAPEEVGDFVLKHDLGEAGKTHFGSFHPSNLGGEFLPDSPDDEIEIARVELRSVTGDVIQVQARPESEGISYRVVDDYWDEGVHYATAPEKSTRPLSFGELIDLMDTALAIKVDEEDAYGPGLVEPNLDYNLEGGAELEDLSGFVIVSSAFYPQLEAYYEARSDAWYQAQREELREAGLLDDDEDKLPQADSGSVSVADPNQLSLNDEEPDEDED